jgi:hypothetical protein
MTRTEGLTVSAGTHVDIALETGWSDAVGDLGNLIRRTAGDKTETVPEPALSPEDGRWTASRLKTIR